MTRHLLKLVWNRKRTNALITLEIFFSFLVVFLVATLGIFFWDNYRQPLGFSYQDVWKIEVDMKGNDDDDKAVIAARLRAMERMLGEVAALGPVESGAATMVNPYDQGGWNSVLTINGKEVKMEANFASTDFAEVMGLELVAGRWFQEADTALGWDPLVIDRDLARTVFGDEDPIGRQLGEPEPEEKPRRVIGVVSEYRKGGELSARTNFMFQHLRFDTPSWYQPRGILIKVRPGTRASFEEDLARLLQALEPEWSFQVKPLAQEREAVFRTFLSPLVAGGIVAFFLLLMVALGLIGVLWQNLIQRTRELGLRRAAGASRTAIHRQVFLEQIILTSFGVLLAAVLIAQLPILDLIAFIRPQVYLGGFLVSMASIYLLSTVCALYPSAMASRVQPVEALRYE